MLSKKRIMRYMTGAQVRPTRVSLHERIMLQRMAIEVIIKATKTYAAKRPKKLRISSALRSRHSVKCVGLFSFASNQDRG